MAETPDICQYSNAHGITTNAPRIATPVPTSSNSLMAIATPLGFQAVIARSASDEAIHSSTSKILDCFAPLAMTCLALFPS